jgi:RNA polymerase sigma-70 factor (ECF subfamily)
LLSDVPDPVKPVIGARAGVSEPTANTKLDPLFRRHSRDLFRFFLRRTGGDATRSEDLVQEVFLSATSDLARRPAAAPTLAWLYTVAHRRLVDDLRHARRQVPTVPFEESHFQSGETPAYGDGVARALTIIVQELPAIQRRVFVMKVLQGQPFSEIASNIGTSEGAARMHLLRALKTIRTELESYGVAP